MIAKSALLVRVVMTFIVSAVFSMNGYGEDDTCEPSLHTPVKQNSNRIIIIRHAQSHGNVNQRYSTHPANPSYVPVSLTLKGREQAHGLGSELRDLGVEARNVARIVSSPLPRAIQTACIVAEKLGFPPGDITLDERLMERNLGLRDGFPYADFPGDHWYPEDPESFNGETSEEVRKRMMAVWESVASLAEEGHVLVVSHGQPIHCLTEILTGNGHRIGNARYVELFKDGSLVHPELPSESRPDTNGAEPQAVYKVAQGNHYYPQGHQPGSVVYF